MHQDDGYERHSIDGLLTAAEYGEPTALGALKDFLRLRTAGRSVVVERSPQYGWRVRDPLSADE